MTVSNGYLCCLQVIIIDESTGRLKDITRWQEGLHQVRLVMTCVPDAPILLQDGTSLPRQRDTYL
jgi:hypothetical protein